MKTKCGNCGNHALDIVDGDKCGGLPGIKYQYCAGCGWSRANVKEQRPAKLKPSEICEGRR